MYRYRRMTDAERRAVVDLRMSRRFPLHKPPHLDLGPGWYFITGTTFEHREHFTDPAELTALQRNLHKALTDANLPCAAWVVQPNHYHLLLEATSLSVVGKALGPVHGRSAHYVNRRDGMPGRRVWYKYSDRKVRSERHFRACIHYVVFNPVKHGFAESIEEWPWSCYHELLTEQGAEWIEGLRRDYPLLEFGREWDD